MALIALHTRDQENPFETANYQHPNDRNEKKPEKKKFVRFVFARLEAPRLVYT